MRVASGLVTRAVASRGLARRAGLRLSAAASPTEACAPPVASLRYFLSKLCRVKKANGQVISCNEISEKNPTTVKNFGIWVRYQSRTGYHNMYKEFRDTTLNGAVEQLYNDMASRHRVR